MPAADFCRPVRPDRSGLSPESETNGRPPEVSSTAFDAQPPDLQPVPLMDVDFAINCPLVRHGMPRIRFLSIGSRLGSTLLSDPASRRHPCASLSLHLHQVVKGTCTLKLSSMLGTQRKGQRGTHCPWNACGFRVCVCARPASVARPSWPCSCGRGRPCYVTPPVSWRYRRRRRRRGRSRGRRSCRRSSASPGRRRSSPWP